MDITDIVFSLKVQFIKAVNIMSQKLRLRTIVYQNPKFIHLHCSVGQVLKRNVV